MEVLQEALDALGLALVEHDHKWTQEERALYERASAYLAKQKTAATLTIRRERATRDSR